MPERTVKQVLVTYVDEDGATRYGLQDGIVTVHPDDLERFDELNGGAPEPEDTPAPKRRTRTPKP